MPRTMRSQTAAATKADEAVKSDNAVKKKRDGMRDTIESIVVAFIFAFLVRSFEAEAFVIPTGSMAQTLMGRHKDVTCPECSHQFQIGASEELARSSQRLERRLKTAICPNCRVEIDIEENPAFPGDRIIVNKFTYDVGNPDRWDVLVFKFPEDPETNYIKRLIGLPGETIEIKQGDVYRVDENGRMEIVRKNHPAKQKALEFLVHDNNEPAKSLREAGWPERWAAVVQDDGPGAVAGWSPDREGWTADENARSFTVDQSAAEEPKWIRYRHFAPTWNDWAAVSEQRPLDPRARLILDFCPYNATTAAQVADGVDEGQGAYWVGDLAVDADVAFGQAGDGAEFLMELVEGPRIYRCKIDPETGLASLSYLDSVSDGDEAVEQLLAEGPTSIRPGSTHHLHFANCDDQLRLWVDGSLVKFDASTDYKPYGALDVQIPSEKDLTPVGMASKSLDVTVSNLKVFRDIYYQGHYLGGPGFERARSQQPTFMETGVGMSTLRSHADNPTVWGQLYYDNLLANQVPPEAYRMPLGPDEFLMLGDNSPKSQDSRLWSNRRMASHRHAVPRSALVGKAFFFLWPHGIPVGNPTKNGEARGYPIPGLDRFCYHTRVDGKLDKDYQKFGVPFYPNFGRIFRPIR
ncbi:signal peptidase I [Calycomorphotria hydatis]|uniref:Signal peptidase I n=1 Tax=Calycomorphotria hydatis TaxID=2528027 RepID=A0A517T721_9PLAN|nr:signal peptidase I [Calycomorphotria hydatis]QDT64159.1 Signal peptidase I [Calycomorphotria hydatis]